MDDLNDWNRYLARAARARVLARMDLLGRNLTTAGALCEAFRAGAATFTGWQPNTRGWGWRR